MALEISAATPLYIQLKAVLLREIESGILLRVHRFLQNSS